MRGSNISLEVMQKSWSEATGSEGLLLASGLRAKWWGDNAMKELSELITDGHVR